ncbi:MAG TPA: hypothetical protein DEP42_03160 [Ruminococcaceae bacterium]|nr:hypothetical protein [Oscillospiraceae bacterium]
MNRQRHFGFCSRVTVADAVTLLVSDSNYVGRAAFIFEKRTFLIYGTPLKYDELIRFLGVNTAS